MTCSRHHAIASNIENGWLLCARCFREALAVAEERMMEAKIIAIQEAMRMRTHSVDALIRRLGA